MAMRKEIQIPDELMQLAKEEFEINWANNKVVIKRFLSGDQWQIQQDSMKVRGTSPTNMSAEVNIADLQGLTIMRAVIEAPWILNDIKAVRDLPGPITEWLKTEIDDLNTITFKKKEN